MIKNFFKFVLTLFLKQKIVFNFDEGYSSLFGKLRKPIAEIKFFDKKKNIWQSITMIIDTGADYSIIPKYQAEYIGIDIKKDTKEIQTQGVGGKAKVYLLKNRVKIKLGNYERSIVLGIIDSNIVPPLLGRYTFFETFRVIFDKYTVTFS